MISGITLAGRAAVMAGISWLARRETPQSVRGQEAPRGKHPQPLSAARGVSGLTGKGHGKNLVRPERGIVPDAWRIDNVRSSNCGPRSRIFESFSSLWPPVFS